MYPTVWWLIGEPVYSAGNCKSRRRHTRRRRVWPMCALLEGRPVSLYVLTTQQQYFSSELQLTQAWEAEMQSYVQLYLALGGGW
jgi:hypothetical protein